MDEDRQAHSDTFLAWLRAIEQEAPSAELAGFFCEDVVAHELPNALAPQGATRQLDDILAAFERGKQAVEDQRYEVLSLVADGDTVAARLAWSARLRHPLGKKPAGTQLTASIASFATFRDGRIAVHHSFDCFDP